MAFQLVYPDVLGAITGGPRAVRDFVQYAIGIFPNRVFMNQPAEVVVVLQNMVNKEIGVQVQMRPPNRDKYRNPVNLKVDGSRYNVTLRPGEVGLVRMPVVAMAPTQPGQAIPLPVEVRTRVPRGAGTAIPVRPPNGGPPPSVVAVSPFRLHVLSDIDFSALAALKPDSDDTPVVKLNLVKRALPNKPGAIKNTYETLWAEEQVDKEQAAAQKQIQIAREVVLSANYTSSFTDFLRQTEERFALAGLPLHPGEAKAIAKMMAYTVDEAPLIEKNVSFETLRWFRMLCQVLAHDPGLREMQRGALYAKYLYDAILLDAIGFAFSVVQPRIDEDLGNPQERVQYASRILHWLAGQGEPDLNYIYLPLVMGGLVVSPIVRTGDRSNPWVMLNELYEATQGRIQLIDGASIVVFEIMDYLLDRAGRELQARRIPRP